VEIETDNANGYRVTLAPSLDPAARLLSVDVNGSSADYSLAERAQNILPTINHVVREEHVSFTIRYLPGPEIYVIPTISPVGAPNEGLKILSLGREGDSLDLKIQGIAGNSYELGLMNPAGQQDHCEIAGLP
jgi:hypothetical protein